MSFIDNAMRTLIGWGLGTVILPFILFFVIVYGLLQSIKIFGKDGAKYNALFAFCLAFFTVYNYSLVDNLPMFIARIAILFLLVIGIMILSGLLGVHGEYSKYKNKIVMVVMLIYITYTIKDIWFKDLVFNIDQTFIFAGIAIAVFGLIVGFIMHTGKEDESSSYSSNTSEKPDKKEKKQEPKKEEKIKLSENEKNTLREKGILEEQYEQILKEHPELKTLRDKDESGLINSLLQQNQRNQQPLPPAPQQPAAPQQQQPPPQFQNQFK